MEINKELNYVKIDSDSDDVFGKDIYGLNNIAYKNVFNVLYLCESADCPAYHGILTHKSELEIFKGPTLLEKGFQEHMNSRVPKSEILRAFESLDTIAIQHLYYAAKYFPFMARAQFWNRFIIANKIKTTPFLGKCAASIFNYLEFLGITRNYSLQEYTNSWQMDSDLIFYLHSLQHEPLEKAVPKLINAYYYEYFRRIHLELPDDKAHSLWNDNVFIDGKIVKADDKYFYKYKNRLRPLSLDFFKEVDEAKDTVFTADFVYIFTYYDKTILTPEEVTVEDCCKELGIQLIDC